MYTIGICDDGKNICAKLEDMILDYAKENNMHIDTEIWYTGEGCCEYLKQGNQLDVLFLDIELLELSGLEVANFIRNQLDNYQMQIVYISSKTSYAMKLFKSQPLDFLEKPISKTQIADVLNLAIKVIGKNNERFEYQCGKNYYSIPFGEIMYFAAEGRKIRIITIHGEKTFYKKLKDITKNLPEGFIMIHQSYVVNKKFIVRYTYGMVELLDKTMLTISKANRKQIRERVLREH